MLTAITYKNSGVDIDAGEKFVDLIKPLARRTFKPGVLGGIGSFNSLFRLDVNKYKKPVLVSGTDGVGTKLKIAFMTGIHDTVGIDLVAMCVNDVLTCGAEPLFFLDYFATGRLNPDDSVKVIEGIVKGCEEAGCALVGGETAEMPGFYADGEYDLSGFAVGAVEEDGIIDGSTIKEGDTVIGLSSSGLHSNGYSLVRKVIFEHARLDITARIEGSDVSLGEELLRPTKIYVKAYEALKGRLNVKGMAHITGGGIPGNLPRVLPDGMSAVIDEKAWPEPPVFRLIRKLGNVPEAEMRRTFNLGIGFIMVVDADSADESKLLLEKEGHVSFIIGKIAKGGGNVVYSRN